MQKYSKANADQNKKCSTSIIPMHIQMQPHSLSPPLFVSLSLSVRFLLESKDSMRFIFHNNCVVFRFCGGESTTTTTTTATHEKMVEWIRVAIGVFVECDLIWTIQCICIIHFLNRIYWSEIALDYQRLWFPFLPWCLLFFAAAALFHICVYHFFPALHFTYLNQIQFICSMCWFFVIRWTVRAK